MFFRIKTTRSGEALQLVESYRNREGKPRQRIEGHLRRSQEKLFNLERTILLYDLTNTHFEGMCEGNTPVEIRVRHAVSEEKFPDGSTEQVEERLVFCRSAGRREKELAICPGQKCQFR